MSLSKSERAYVQSVDAGNRDLCNRIGEGNSAIVMESAATHHTKKPNIATVRDGRLVIDGVVMPPACIGKMMSMPFKWHTWDGVVVVDGKTKGAYFHFPKTEVVIATLPDGRSVMHGGDAGGCTIDGVRFAGICEAMIAANAIS